MQKKLVINTCIGLALIAAALFALWQIGFVRFEGGVPKFGGIQKEKEAPEILSHEVKYRSDLSPDIRATLEANIANLKAAIAASPLAMQSWLDLALQYKIAGDLDGAMEIWRYLTKISPEQSVAFFNLANTYHYDFKDYPKSEAHFKEAIAANPGMAINYLGLHELYRYSYKQDTTLAADTLLEGLAAVKDKSRIDIQIQLAIYYASKGDSANAIKYYQEARAAAKLLGKSNLVRDIDREIARLQSQ